MPTSHHPQTIQIQQALEANSNPKRTQFSHNYFPRGAELGTRNDMFFGGTVPSTRTIARQYSDLDLIVIEELLASDYHEMRLCGLMILRIQMTKAIKTKNTTQINVIKEFYLSNISAVDHWDLVDESAAELLGVPLVYNTQQKLKDTAIPFESLTYYNDAKNGFPILNSLLKSSTLWHQRIAIVSQFAFIKAGNVAIPLSICADALDNHHHYIQKATGWVLREIGKHDKQGLDEFIHAHVTRFGSICLSYTLEKHTTAEKQEIRALRSFELKK